MFGNDQEPHHSAGQAVFDLAKEHYDLITPAKCRLRVSVLPTAAWPPATGEILIERDAFQVAKASIGDAIVVKTANGVEQPLVISGSVHDVGQAQARMENIVYGYINLATLVQLGEEPYLNQLNILVAENRFDEDHTNASWPMLKKRSRVAGMKSAARIYRSRANILTQT